MTNEAFRRYLKGITLAWDLRNAVGVHAAVRAVCLVARDGCEPLETLQGATDALLMLVTA